MPHHSEQNRYSGSGGYYDEHPSNSPGSSEYADNDYHQSYHCLNTDEREKEVEKPPIQTVSAEVLFGTADQRNRPTHVSLLHIVLMYIYVLPNLCVYCVKEDFT